MKTLNAKNLEALGAERLAELLIEISKGRPAARRLLRLELAGAQGTAELAREVRHRMATIRRSRAVIDSRRRRDLVDDLELCRRTIVDRIAGEDAAEALDLMWQYMRLANPIQNRLHYTDETIAGAFSASDLGDIASSASPDPHKLAERAFEALTENAHGQYGDLIGALMPALGREGLERLKQLMTVNGGGIMHHAERSGGPVAAAQNCATHGPLLVVARGRRCTAWSSMRRFDWRLSTRG